MRSTLAGDKPSKFSEALLRRTLDRFPGERATISTLWWTVGVGTHLVPSPLSPTLA